MQTRRFIFTTMLLTLAVCVAGCSDSLNESQTQSKLDQAEQDQSGRVVSERTVSGQPQIDPPFKTNANAPSQRQGQPVQKARTGQSNVFVEHKLTDPGMNNAHSHTFLAPEGWQLQGGVIRPNIKLYNMPVVLDLKVTAPDGRQAHIMPTMSFEFNNNQPAAPGTPTTNGNLYMPLPESAGQWLLQMARNNPQPGVRDLKLINEKMDEKITAQLRQQAAPIYQSIAQFNQMSGTTGVAGAYDTQAEVLTFTYTEDGRPFEETFLVCWHANLSIIHGQVSSGMWGISMMVSVRDAPGKDPTTDPMIQTIFQSMRPTAQWQSEMNSYWQKLSQIRAKGAADRRHQNAQHNAYMQRNREEINDIIAGGYKNRQATIDRGHQRSVDTIRGVTPYQTPSGNTIRLPSFYDHAYTDGNGRYLLNNDANYNPTSTQTSTSALGRPLNNRGDWLDGPSRLFAWVKLI